MKALEKMASSANSCQTVNILGVHAHSVPLGCLVDLMLSACKEGGKIVVPYVNVHAVNLAYQVSWFRKFLNSSELVFCDGFGVKWAAALLHKIPLHRYTPPDWFPRLSAECARQGVTVYFLGARPGVAEKAAFNLQADIPGLQIVGAHHGYFDKQPHSIEQDELIDQINRLQPNILVVGFGMPLQERWIKENFSSLNVNVFLPVGAFFDYLAGEVLRAPRWMTDHSLEWLGRLIIEPRRLWKRYLVGNPLFFWRVFKHHVLGFPLPYP